MGNLYRFVEPILLLLLKRKGDGSYGYDLASEVEQFAMTDSEIDRPAVYRTLRQLEEAGCVRSTWDTGRPGPARRVYKLTPSGARRLKEWTSVLETLSGSMSRFVSEARQFLGS